MDSETLKSAMNPFYTSKASREKKVGLGIPLFMQNAESCDGCFHVDSQLGKGTNLEAVFKKSHIDRMPVGSLADTMIGSIIGHTETDFYLKIKHNTLEQSLYYEFDTRVLKEELGDVPFDLSRCHSIYYGRCKIMELQIQKWEKSDEKH